MHPARLGVCIIACNEERDIPRCLDAAAFADEVVVVVDSRSRDRTEAIARQRGARVFRRAYLGNIEQKNFALEQLGDGIEWVLGLDADEAPGPELVVEIRSLLAEPPGEVRGYEINRATWHLGRWIRHGDFYPDWQLRLFRRGARYAGVNPHGHVCVAGPTRRLRGEIAHYAYRDLSDQVARIQDFSSVESQARPARPAPAVVWDLVTRPPARFLRAYLLKQGFRDGVAGFIIAWATAFHVFLKYAKEWERRTLGARGAVRPAEGKAGRAAEERSETGAP